jgi:hypothetical protein
MPIDLIVDTLDSVESGLRDAYVESDGKFQLDPEKYHAIKAAPLAKKNQQLLDEKKKIQEATRPYERLKPLAEIIGEDDDPEEISKAIEAYRKRQAGNEGENGKNGADQQRALEMAQKLHEKQVKRLNDDLAAIKAQHEEAARELREFRLWTPLREQFIKAGGDPAEWELARLDLANQRRFDFDEDRRIVVMEDGVPSSVSPEQFFKQVYADQRPKFYKASEAGGSGANPRQATSGGKTKTMKRADWNALPETKRAAFFKEGGQLID